MQPSSEFTSDFASAPVSDPVPAATPAAAAPASSGMADTAAPRPLTRACVGLGANLGEPVAALQQAVARLAALPGTRLVAVSSLYRTAPVDAGGPDYFNAVATLDTTLSAASLLYHLHIIEDDAGRQRPYRNAPRTLDLDLLLHGNAPITTPVLTVPHPRMHERAFVLLPLAELEPERVTPAMLHAVAGQRIDVASPGSQWADLPTAHIPHAPPHPTPHPTPHMQAAHPIA